MTSRKTTAKPPKKKDDAMPAPTGRRTLTMMQKVVLGLAIAPMLAVGVAGGIGTYSNISAAYGQGTAVGALAAGEGATAVLALLLLGLTMLGQTAPAVIRIGLWALPATAAVMGATAGEHAGETIVYALTPMAITASAEGLAFLVRRIVVHQEGRDVEAEARAAALVRDLAYHQARASAHPSNGARKRSVRKSWRLARKVGAGDTTLGDQLMDVQRVRLTTAADAALSQMFQPSALGSAPALPAAPQGTPLALVSGGQDDATTPRRHDVTADDAGYPDDATSGQASGASADRKPKGVRGGLSIASAVRDAVASGATDATHIARALAERFGRREDDPKFQETVARYVRAQATADQDVNRVAGYL